MLTQSGFYALQATIRLAREPDRLLSARAIADDLQIPADYLGKVLQRLGREGLVEATRGPLGGYRLTSSPDQTTVAAVVAPFELARPREQCLMGGLCDVASPCPAHRRRLDWVGAYQAILQQTTLADLLGGRTNGTAATPEPSKETLP